VRRDERGSTAPLELVLLAIPFLSVMMLIVFAGRVVRVDGTLDGVAHYAALRAAQARSAPDADSVAQTAVADDLAGSSRLPCETTDIVVDTSDFGSGGTVEVRVSCQVRLSDLGPLPIPGTRVVTARSVAAVDVFRGTS
jgi:Flp pilus assembly protein TadG